MLDTLAMEQGGTQYRRLVGAFQRIVGATIFFGTDTQREHAMVVHRARFNLMSETRIWYSRDPDQKLLPGDCQNVIVLSDEFYREILDHPIPAGSRRPRLCPLVQQILICFGGFRIGVTQRGAGNACLSSASSA